MQNTQARYVILLGVLVFGCVLLVAFGRPSAASASRWPSADSLYEVAGWWVGDEAVDSQIRDVHVISRRYVRTALSSATAPPSRTVAQLFIRTNTEAKNVYRYGGDLAFLGSGYSSEPAPPDLLPPGHDGYIVRRDNDLALVLTAYGERRGLVGNGPVGWGLAVFDGLLGRPNDYFQATLFVPLDRLDSPAVPDAVALADTVFQRLAIWYAD